MDKLVEVLNALIEKYQFTEEDIALVQEALSELENGAEEEFTYEENEEEEEV